MPKSPAEPAPATLVATADAPAALVTERHLADEAPLPDFIDTPYMRELRQKANSRWTHAKAWRPRLIDGLKRTPAIRKACAAAKVDHKTVDAHRRADPVFAAAYEAAHALCIAEIHDECFRRGFEGWDEPVYQGGKIVGTVRKYSDRMAETLLKGHMPEVFGDKMDVNVKGAVAHLHATPADVMRIVNEMNPLLLCEPLQPPLSRLS